MELAVVTGIPPSVWAAEGGRAVVTAYELLDEARRAQQRQWEKAFG